MSKIFLNDILDNGIYNMFIIVNDTGIRIGPREYNNDSYGILSIKTYDNIFL